MESLAAFFLITSIIVIAYIVYVVRKTDPREVSASCRRGRHSDRLLGDDPESFRCMYMSLTG